ncbi:MAG: hypothetical protein ABFC67_13460 [Mizugakiibacter sp.]|uniref:hypothetical protein n=1 Tax=Mizugakiibacter sp. TaxID=1972610 RepID=UPI0031CC2125|nr:hypothetical protein [Xanthomonadaceae bacterium]
MAAPTPPAEPAAPRAREGRRNWDALAAVVAALIGFLALVVSGYTAYIQRQQVRAQVWPFLVVGNDDLAQSVLVYNKGVGPAIVRTAQIWIDGKPRPDWQHVLDALGVAEPRRFIQSTLNPNVLTPGSELQMIRFPDKEVWQHFRTQALHRMSMAVCFCSTLDECWMYSDRHPVGYKAPTLLVQPVDRCPRLPVAEIFNN